MATYQVTRVTTAIITVEWDGDEDSLYESLKYGDEYDEVFDENIYAGSEEFIIDEVTED